MTQPTETPDINRINKYLYILVIAVIYFVTARLGLLFAYEGTNATPVWAPSGIALAVILLRGYKMSPAIFIGALAVNFQVLVSGGSGLQTALFISFFTAIGNTLEAIAGAYLIRRFKTNTNLQGTTKAAFVYIFGALVAASIGAILGSTIFCLVNSNWSIFGRMFVNWLIGDTLGILIVASLIIYWRDRKYHSWKKLKQAEFLLFLIAVLIFVFFMSEEQYIVNFLLIPFLLWSIFRYGKFETFLLITLICGLSVGLGSRQEAIDNLTQNKSLIVFQLFYGITTVTFIILGAILDEQKSTKEKLEENKNLLKNIIDYSPSLIYVFDTNGRTLLTNKNYQELFKLPKNQLTGLKREQFLPQEVAIEKEGSDLEIIKQKKPKTFEEENVEKDGVHSYLTSKFPLFDKSGEIYAVCEISTDITLFKHVEKELKESEAKFKSLTEIAPVGIFNTDSTGKTTYVNRVWCQLAGINFNEALGYGWMKAVHPADRNMISEGWKQAVLNNNFSSTEYRFLRPDGTIVWISGSASPQKDENGNLAGYIGTATDITERKLAEDSLKKSEEKYRFLFERNPALMLIYNRENLKLLAVNESFEKHYGYSNKEALNMFLPDLYPEEEKKSIIELTKKIRGHSFAGEWHHIKKDGSVMSILATSNDEEYMGQEARIAVITDITNLKKVEEENKKTNEELKAINKIISTTTSIQNTKEMLDGILVEALNIVGLEGGTICLIEENDRLVLVASRETSKETITDLTTNIVKVGNCIYGNCAKVGHSLILSNPDEILKYATREAIQKDKLKFHAAFPIISKDKTLGVLSVFTRTDKKPAKRSLKLLETLTIQVALAIENSKLFEKLNNYTSQLEKRIKERTIELTNSQTELLALVEDLDKTNERLKEANIKLRELDQLKSMFIASMSHELRTPLNSIIGFSGILLMGLTGELNEEQKRQLTFLKGSATHLLALISDIIDVSKIEAGKIEFEIEEVGLKDIADEVFEIMLPLAEQKSLEFKSIGFENIHLEIDARRIKQVLINLVNNGIKFTDKGSVIMQAEKDKKKITISVIDTGLGISKENQDKLFKAFSQIRNSGDVIHEGTGLGLYLSKKIIEHFKGKIWVESERGKGSRFVLELDRNLKL